MNVLVVGGGGREHALCWALAGSPLVDRLYCAPGNAGIAAQAACLPIDALDAEGLVGLCRSEAIEFVVVGPEAPLVAGLVDRLEAAGIAAFGPGAAAAALEGSKGFMKDFCARHGIPTAGYRRCADLAAARAAIAALGAPVAVKADGLAAGKGVVVAQTAAEAEAAAAALLRSGGLVIERFLEGEEASFFALCDGATAVPFGSAQDHKRAYDGDFGPNTGGMGAYSPAPALTPALERAAMERIVLPTLRGMAAEGRPYKGVLYAGLMLTGDGPQLLEYNVRFGDPECQVLMTRLKSDLLPALLAARDGVLDAFDVRWSAEAALCVVLAGKGYPDEPRKGGVIAHLDAAGELPGVTIFHAATRRDASSRILANGGRVLGVTALGATVAAAQARAYEAVDVIDWSDGFCRRDIGWRAVEREGGG